MVSLPFASELAWETGSDYFNEDNRHWTLFDHALAATGETLEKADSAFAGQQSAHARQLQLDESRYWATMKSHDVAAPPTVARPEARFKFLQADVKPRIMKQVSAHLRTKFPKVIQEASIKLGKKQAVKAPAAAFDGPFPFVETALLIWGVYDVGVGAAELRSNAQKEVAKIIRMESNAIGLEADKHTTKQILRAEELAHLQRCKALNKALSGLIFPKREAELAQRCTIPRMT